MTSSSAKKPKRINLSHLQKMKQQGEKITVLTAYDASFAKALSDAGVEMLLVGDTLGMVVCGHNTTVPVTIDDMIYHIRNVARANPRALIIGDMPFLSYPTIEKTLENAGRLMQAGAEMVKLEGGAWLIPTIEQLSEKGIPVCAHLGLTPQSVHSFGGYNIPVIGIGAGPYCDGQVLVTYDMLGLHFDKPLTFVENFLQGQTEGISGAVKHYVEKVKAGTFPSLEQSFT